MLLLEREEMWRLKSRATWLESGDKNTKFFHAFAKGRKAANTIWRLVDDLGNTQDTFDGMASLGLNISKNCSRILHILLLLKSSELRRFFQVLWGQKKIKPLWRRYQRRN